MAIHIYFIHNWYLKILGKNFDITGEECKMITEVYSKARWKRSVFTLDLKSASSLDARIRRGGNRLVNLFSRN